MKMFCSIRAMFVLAALALCPLIGAHAGEFTVTVKLSNPNNYPISLTTLQGDGFTPVKQVATRDGYPVFTGSIDGIAMADLLVRGPNSMVQIPKGGIIPGPTLSFVVRGGVEAVIEGDAAKPYLASVRSADPEVQAYETFRAKDKAWVSQQWDAVRAQAQKGADPQNDKATEKLRSAWMKEFVAKHRGTYAAIEVFAMYALDLPEAEQAAQFATLPATYKTTPLGKKIQEKIDASAAAAVGKPMLPFAQPGSDGKVVDLAAMKGKVILLDFWGSWCVPCRAGHPHLKQLYEKYKSQGFEIVGVAVENGTRQEQERAWRAAMKKDGITWLQVLNATEHDITKMYGVVAYPTKILIDRKGIIRVRHLSEGVTDLDAQLEQLLRAPR